MPAYINTESRRQTHRHTDTQTHRHTDRQTSADNTALGFGTPEFSGLPVAGSPYRMASTVHQTWGNFLSRRIGCLPARPLASALRRLAPLHRKLSSAPDTSLLPSRASDLHWTLLS